MEEDISSSSFHPKIFLISAFVLVCSILLLVFGRSKILGQKSVLAVFQAPTPTPSATVTPSPSPTASPTPSPTITPTPTVTPTPSPSPTPFPTANPEDTAIWDKLAECETHQNWSADTGNGYYGGLQFNLTAWASVGGSGKPSDASRDEQILRGKTLQAQRGWGAWSDCGKRLGLY